MSVHLGRVTSLSSQTWCRVAHARSSWKVWRSQFNSGLSCRGMAGQSDSPMNVFDRKAKRIQKNRTALMEDYRVYEYLKEEIGYRVADRICDVKRKFGVAVDLGCGRGHVSKHIYSDMVGTLYQCDMADRVLMQSELSPEVPTHRVIADEEYFPFKDNSLDMVVSSLSLHWVNDLPGCFRQVHNALKDDGVFIGSMFGGDTLFELRVSLQLAETEKEGGFAPHISPFTDVRDLGNLLTRSGYTMLTIDTDELVVNYPSMYELMQDLKGMGENNCSWNRKPLLHRDTTAAAAAIYKDMHGNEDGVPATFQIMYFIGWKPDKSQAAAAMRGSGQVSLKDIDQLDKLTKDFHDAKDRYDKDRLDEIAEQLQDRTEPDTDNKK
ncbi:arginine-hydroxylase NDUFAF5, mitochondrial-like [Haliotis rufescens]|uniref:arginine-hydroxylase NDUFAF5, mitochondrial-like n=1 Tax=Haliotis rufescens TaxID=6454 RepID=UPI00201F3C0B|nr:arginine-hydroxylase NDUFAF5, mitochondrial-like [Haliotis rufescens]